MLSSKEVNTHSSVQPNPNNLENLEEINQPNREEMEERILIKVWENDRRLSPAIKNSHLLLQLAEGRRRLLHTSL